MQDFYYHIPTEIYFGRGQIKQLPHAVKKYGKKALLVYGGGSIKKSGIYDQILEMLKEAEIDVAELSGIEANPRLTTVEKGIQICREAKADVIVPVGGGSVIDCAKAIAAGVFYDGDTWDLVLDGSKITQALPIITVLTIAATGSEMDWFGVITNTKTLEKQSIANRLLLPKASIMDPTYTFTVSKYQTAAGVADIISHLMENYFKRVEGAFMQRKMTEALLETCFRYGKVAIDEPDNYEARANLMWTSSWAINGFLSSGFAGAWFLHPIEHQLSAYYDITHGVGLALIIPPWMRKVLNEDSVDLFYEYGVNVLKIAPSEDKFQVANQAIDKTEQYFAEMGIPRTLREAGVPTRDKIPEMAEKAMEKGAKNAYFKLTTEDIIEIYEAAF